MCFFMEVSHLLNLFLKIIYCNYFIIKFFNMTMVYAVQSCPCFRITPLGRTNLKEGVSGTHLVGKRFFV